MPSQEQITFGNICSQRLRHNYFGVYPRRYMRLRLCSEGLLTQPSEQCKKYIVLGHFTLEIFYTDLSPTPCRQMIIG